MEDIKNVTLNGKSLSFYTESIDPEVQEELNKERKELNRCRPRYRKQSLAWAWRNVAISPVRILSRAEIAMLY